MAAMSGGMVGVVVAVISLVGTVLVIRWLNKYSNDYDSYEWPIENPAQTAEV